MELAMVIIYGGSKTNAFVDVSFISVVAILASVRRSSSPMTLGPIEMTTLVIWL